MWILVMFDLPVLEKAERKAATDFRNALLDFGFEMAQISVYVRFCTGPIQVESYCKRIEDAMPPGGKVKIQQFTDTKYERIMSDQGKERQSPKKAHEKFNLL